MAASTSPSGFEHACLEQAAEWYASLQADDADAALRADWQRWLDASPAHALAWRRVEAVARRFEALRAPAQRAAVQAGLDAARRQRGRRRALQGLLSLTGLGLLTWIGWRSPGVRRSLSARTADYHAATGEIRRVVLADGTEIWLDSGSALDVDYRPDLRRLHLLDGRLRVQTAADARPLVVDTAFGRLRALGTRFVTRVDARAAWLEVYQGAVAIEGRTVPPVTAGWRQRFDAGHTDTPRPLDPDGEAWADGRLIAAQMPLKKLVAELARYRRGHLGLAPGLAELPIIGVYPLDDTDRALAMLERSLPVRVRRILPWWVSIEPRADGGAEPTK